MISQFIDYLKKTGWPVWLLCFYIFIWFMQIGNRIEILGSIRIEFLVGSCLILLSVKEWFNREKNPLYFHYGFVRSIIFLYVIFFLYTFFSMDKESSWATFSDRIVKFSMFTLFISCLVKNKYGIKLVLIGFMVAMLKIIQEGVFGSFFGNMIWQNQGIPRLHGVTLMYRHPNSLSGLAVGALPFFLFLFKFQSKILKYVFAGAVAGLLMIILYTGSRTGYVAVIVLFMAILIRFGVFKLKTISSLLVLILLALIIVPQDYKDRFGTMFKSGEERGSSAEKRIEILEDAWAIAKEHPLGVGVSAFPYVRDLEFNRQQDTHNLYLEILTNIGPFGAIAFIVFVATLFKINRVSRLIFIRRDEYFLAELCYIVNLYILCRLALGLFGMDLYEVYWWFAAGLTIALAKLSVNEVVE